ncbi:MAG: class I SAM-dependent DNA methyltransferase [Candidatus Hodarchaeota archaeon]
MTDIYKIMAKYYDQMYSWKDYEGEAQRLHEIIQKYKSSPENDLLDVGCGTGGHIDYLKQNYNVSGLDLSEEMLAVAKEKHKDIPFFCADMTNMQLNRQYDVITSLFGSIGHLTTQEALEDAIRSFSRHTKPGGVVIIEPFVTTETVHPKAMGINCVDLPDVKIARVSRSRLEGNIAYLDFHFLIATENGVEHLFDPSPMGIFPRAIFMELMEKHGYSVDYIEPGLMERTGLFVGVKR